MNMLKKMQMGKIFYAFVFCVIVPCLLWNAAYVWQAYTQLKPIYSPWCGCLLIGVGLILMLGAMLGLKMKGGGLPMNGFPPPNFVSSGCYRVMPHPIYWGFCLSVIGGAVALGSAAGLYVVAPLAILGCVAIVWGYERQDLIRRFGQSAPRTFFSLPPDSSERASILIRLKSLFLVLIFGLLVVYLIVLNQGILGHLCGVSFVSLNDWWSSVFVLLPPLCVLMCIFCKSLRDCRCLCVWGYWFFACSLFAWLLIPAIDLPGQICVVEGEPLFLLANESSIIAMLPVGIYFALALVTLEWKHNNRIVAFMMACFGAYALKNLVALDSLSVKIICAELLIFVLVLSRGYIVRGCMRGAEWLANSWCSWQIGPWRIINHSIYVFLSAAIGYILIIYLAGFGYAIPGVIVALCSLIGAGLWAQLIEGSPRLLRPFGYYGAIFGGILGILLAWGWSVFCSVDQGFDVWVLFAAIAVASPWIQLIGRFRCLVQGCCHGHPVAPGQLGIVHVHPASRVCKLTEWAGVPLHATPVYSIGLNLIAGLVLVRLWYVSVPAELLIGLYFMLAGLSRFVEEAYRGEPQTCRPAGLSVYQWLSVGFVVLAFVFWNMPVSMVYLPAPVFSWYSVPIACAVGALFAFCMSTDFPHSNKRFARLTS